MILAATTVCRCRTALLKVARRKLHATFQPNDITRFQMPAMSPTMTEGSILEWKKKEGEVFTAGDILLEIETDKASIDVEAQEDGVMGKIIAPDGTKNIPVGKTIALLAEQADDISGLEIPPEELTASASSAPQEQPLPSRDHSPDEASHMSSFTTMVRPFFPSVLRLLHENHISDPDKIKGSGIRGMLTKGDILAYLGRASSPTGSFKENTPTPSIYKSQAILKEVDTSTPEKKALDPLGIRQNILTALLERSSMTRIQPPQTASFESVIADYLPQKPVAHGDIPPSTSPQSSSHDYLAGLH